MEQISRNPLAIHCFSCGAPAEFDIIRQNYHCRHCGSETGIQEYVRAQMPVWREQYDGVENMTLAVMGCVVNGPGESKHANIGISLPGTGETPAAPVFVDGEKVVTLRGDNIAAEFKALVDNYVATRYVKKGA